MSRLREMIKELCPDGVEYCPIKDCVESVEKIEWKKTDETYRYIDLSSVDRDDHTIGETLEISADDAPSRAQQVVKENDILLGTTRPMLKRYCQIPSEYDNQICSTGFCVLRANNTRVLSRWLYHMISTTAFFDYVDRTQHGSSYPAISDKEVKAYDIPVPPLPIQNEIVKLLDNFTELTAELTLRKKQYEYYRARLLSFEKEQIEWVKIESICSIQRGRVMSKGYIAENKGNYPVYSSQTENNGELGRISSFDFEGEYLTWTTDGANAGTVFYRDGKFSVTNVCGLLKVKSDALLTKYLYYVLSIEAPKYVNSGMGNPKLMSNVMACVKIPLPLLKRQKEIVTILDRFDTLCNDLTQGLPAEIAARKKQYEYYRDKLLTFRRKEA